jgi:hypothetical protein
LAIWGYTGKKCKQSSEANGKKYLKCVNNVSVCGRGEVSDHDDNNVNEVNYEANPVKTGKLSLVINYKCLIYECFKPSFGLIRAKMADIEPFKDLVQVQTYFDNFGSIKEACEEVF